jgi:hypothetical protein
MQIRRTLGMVGKGENWETIQKMVILTDDELSLVHQTEGEFDSRRRGGKDGTGKESTGPAGINTMFRWKGWRMMVAAVGRERE